MPWIDVADHATLTARGWMEVEAGPAAILLFDRQGEVYATTAICPHHAAFLSQGEVTEDFIDCPRHQGRFRIMTGEQVGGPPCGALPLYATRVTDGRVLVDLQARRNGARP